ncbi:MAG TPA: MBL fold metallo-hydrolase [Chloroflexota bacterium]
MQVWSLGSGSSGNAYLLCARDTLVLVDCGLGLRTLEHRLAAAGVAPEALTAVLVTHEHSDHLGGVPALVRRYDVPVYATAGTLRAANGKLAGTAQTHTVMADRAFSVGDFAVHPFAVPHDATEPVGYRLNTGRARAVILTDLGHVPPYVAAQLGDVELLVLEFNHDVEQLVNGPYHAKLKRRIASPLGHLSNTDAAACLTGALSRTHRAVWLAHLSETNNTQRRAGDAARAAARAAGYPDLPIQIAARGRVSLHWDLDTPHQLRLF